MEHGLIKKTKKNTDWIIHEKYVCILMSEDYATFLLFFLFNFFKSTQDNKMKRRKIWRVKIEHLGHKEDLLILPFMKMLRVIFVSMDFWYINSSICAIRLSRLEIVSTTTSYPQFELIETRWRFVRPFYWASNLLTFNICKVSGC